MTQEEKLLLFKDLSARLPYGVIVNYKEDKYDFHHWKISTLHAPAYSKSGSLIKTDSDGWIEYNEYKGCGMSTGSRPLHLEITLPYLRPMSSMTEEEKKEYDSFLFDNLERENVIGYEDKAFGVDVIMRYRSWQVVQWLLKHHLDFNGLIDVYGLALKAPEGMYK